MVTIFTLSVQRFQIIIISSLQNTLPASHISTIPMYRMVTVVTLIGHLYMYQHCNLLINHGNWWKSMQSEEQHVLRN